MRTRPLHFYPLLFPFDNLIQVNETPSPPMQVMSRTNGSTRCCRTNRNDSKLLNKIRERSCFSGKGISTTGIASTPHRSELPCLDLDNASSTLLPRGAGSHYLSFVKTQLTLFRRAFSSSHRSRGPSSSPPG